MTFQKSLGSLFSRKSLRDDTVAGVVLGVESVPDGLAAGLLAGVNPVFGLYSYMVGVFAGGLGTSAVFMAVQGTGALAVIVADVPQVHSGANPERALFTLTILTGVVMLMAGLLKLGTLLRWVSNSVMVGFINAIGVNVILGQLDNLSGYEAEGLNRVTRALNLLLNLGEVHWRSFAIGAATVALIILLERTRVGPLGLVVGVIATSAVVPLFGWTVLHLNDIAEVPGSLPLPIWPDLTAIPSLLIPAGALAFIGLVQGAGISASFPNPDGSYPDASRDFIGQGAANIAAGFFQGIPVGGSTSASALIREAGAKSKTAHLVAGVVMAISIIALGPAVGYVAMPALAGLLILVGYRTVKPHDIKAVWRTGRTQAVVMGVTFTLTMIIPLHIAVLVGVGISIILYVIKQSGRITVRRLIVREDGRLREDDAPSTVGAHEVVALQPYGSLFFASAPVFEEMLPEITSASVRSVVIIRLRGQTELGSTFMEVLSRYGASLQDAGSRLVINYPDQRTRYQLEATGVAAQLGEENLYESDEWHGATLIKAYTDALTWVEQDKDA